MLDWGEIPSIEQNAGTVSGAWVFKGTRVPVRAVFENLSDDFIAEFCYHFPTSRKSRYGPCLNTSQERSSKILPPPLPGSRPPVAAPPGGDHSPFR